MFFNRKHLLELDYKVMGLDFHSNRSCNHYVKYFPENNSMVVFSTVHNNRVMVYKLTKEQYDDFQVGKYALSEDGNGHGNTPNGYPIKNYGLTVVFGGGALRNRIRLKEILASAEKIAKQ